MKDSLLHSTPRAPFNQRALGPMAAATPAGRSRSQKPSSLLFLEAGAQENLLDRCFLELVRYYRHSFSGRLCRGIIHQMNSPLQVLFFQLELLEQKSREELKILSEVSKPVGEKLQALHNYRLEKIRQFRLELENIQALAQKVVLQGGHEEAEEQVSIDLNELYRRELDLYLAHPFFKHRVEKKFIFQGGLPPIYGHYINFSQSFRNLLENALEAMEGSARCQLTVETALEGNQRILHLGDTGAGISPEVMSRIFEPFFTTKGDALNVRAGLGMYMARRLLAPYGGEIHLNSVPGETWVTVTLPVK